MILFIYGDGVAQLLFIFLPVYFIDLLDCKLKLPLFCLLGFLVSALFQGYILN